MVPPESLDLDFRRVGHIGRIGRIGRAELAQRPALGGRSSQLWHGGWFSKAATSLTELSSAKLRRTQSKTWWTFFKLVTTHAMIQLNVLAGRRRGEKLLVESFPVVLGRGGEGPFQFEESGVWDCHAELDLDPKKGYSIRTKGDAFTLVNGERIRETRLRNGDLIEMGSAKLQFWLAEVSQKPLWAREYLTWVGLGAISLGQVTLIYWLS